MKGNEDLRGKGGKKILGGKLGRRSAGGGGEGKDLVGGQRPQGKALGGKGGKGSQQGKAAKDLGHEKGEDLRGKIFGSKGRRSQGGKRP